MKKYIYIITLLILCLLNVKAQKTFTVVIDPGHGGKDPGCVGAISKEKVINLAVALKLGKLIEQNYKDVKIIYTRKTDVFIALDERANIANRNKADLFISIHVNSVRRGNASGTETYTIGL
ncbi:MAG: N-acetylmuramoyl-L-alanine amidase, partial [Tannerella sp.]|nr:N-acetylmuramoyl-L-alanine amidase [Tannerella sp.]